MYLCILKHKREQLFKNVILLSKIAFFETKINKLNLYISNLECIQKNK